MNSLSSCAGGADRFVVVDTETTGVYPTDRIIEIAIVTLSLHGDVIDTYETLVQPGRHVGGEHVHGITPTMLAGAPTFEEIVGDVAVRLHGACMVAHNLPFDLRMLSGEFKRLGSLLFVPAGIDTLRATGSRLSAACAMWDVDLTDHHRASSDALATASLFVKVAQQCSAGLPIEAPLVYGRSGLVMRREDVASVVVEAPPLVVYLASRLPHAGADVAVLQYLEVLGVAMSDLHLSAAERRELQSLASDLGLTAEHAGQAHRRYVNDLVDAVLGDGVVTDDEYAQLVRVAAALSVSQEVVERRVRPHRLVESSIELSLGMSVVFTGEHPLIDRDSLAAKAQTMGLSVQTNVSKATSLVAAADLRTTSGKAAKARKYGIPIVDLWDFARSEIGDSLVAHGGGVTSLKVVTCPECLSNWSVPATSAESTSRLCGDCVASKKRDTRKSVETGADRPGASGDSQTVGRQESLTCSKCGQIWSRLVTRGRKPLLCPTCSS